MGLINELRANNIDEMSEQKIRQVYLNYGYPWIVGYSGGKDSTTVVQLIYNTLKKMKKEGIELSKKVYIISSDTMVENPLVAKKIYKSIDNINNAVKNDGLSDCISARIVSPEHNQSFWVNVIGRGYPVPNQTFRWCTDRLKIAPANKFILDVVSNNGYAILVLGLRRGESNSRDIILKNREIDDRLLMKHSSLNNAFTFAPVIDFNVDDIWEYLLKNECPWGDDNRELYKMYADSSDGECPLIIDTYTKDTSGSCGNSRFGCWSCTVVAEDKSLSNFIKNQDVTWLQCLLDFRDELARERDDRSKRYKTRRNGAIYLVPLKEKLGSLIVSPKLGRRACNVLIDKLVLDEIVDFNEYKFMLIEENNLPNYIKDNCINLEQAMEFEFIVLKNDGTYTWLGLGPYTMVYRKKILEKLLNICKETGNEFITDSEVKFIASLWNEEFPILEYNKLYEGAIDLKIIKESQIITSEDEILLREMCEIEQVSYEVLKDLLTLEARNNGLKSRVGIKDSVNRILNADKTYLSDTRELNEDK